MEQEQKKAVIILPTYNERENIEKLLNAIQEQKKHVEKTSLSIVVVDDCSPDGTGEIVKAYSEKNSNVSLLNGTNKQGLGAAYIRGFKYALHKLNADVVFEMDADFSHNPQDIPHLLHEALNGSDFVIGSRYVTGGSIPKNWSGLRKANSKWGNIFARYVAGLKGVKDCTSGFRAIKTSLLKKINLDKLGVKGYAFQMNLLHRAIETNAVVTELPIQFADRQFGKSKLKIKDIQEFILNAFIIRFPFLKLLPIFITFFSVGFIFGLLAIATFILINKGVFTTQLLIICTIASLSLLISLQALFSLWWMIYAWDHPERARKNKSPDTFIKPNLSFTALVPVRNEEKVIGQTIKAISNINYPEDLKEIIIICRYDDSKTIAKVIEAISSLGKNNIKLAIFNDLPINKPHALNIGLQQATKDIVVIFDAEDEPHKDIFNIANTVMNKEKADVLQSGVQLMNYRSTWFSTLNVLEYFFWFKSTLHFFANIGIIPLGGNTVFFKKNLLNKIGGWDENCLTEDADIGIRLCIEGARIRTVYDEQHVTQEESPLTLLSFIKQRTRWCQGFIQILLKGEWLNLSTKTQRFLAGYILVSPELQALLFAYLPISLIIIMYFKLPVWLVLLSSLSFYILFLQFITYNIGLYLFSKDYQLKFYFWLPLKIMITFIPFQLILGFSAARALTRLLKGNNAWEKTQHVNAHRTPILKISS